MEKLEKASLKVYETDLVIGTIALTSGSGEQTKVILHVTNC